MAHCNYNGPIGNVVQKGLSLVSCRLPKRKGFYLCVEDPEHATLHVVARFLAKTNKGRTKAYKLIENAVTQTVKRLWEK